MLENVVKKVDSSLSPAKASEQQKTFALWPVLIAAAIFVLSALFYDSVLFSLSGFSTNVWISKKITWFGRWIPTDLTTGVHSRLTQHKTGFKEMMLLLGIMFVTYGFCAWFINRRARSGSLRFLFGLLWLGVLVVSVVYLLTPGMMASDVYSYASYGRLLMLYHANPYFVPPSAFPHDITYQWLYWHNTVSIYGPIWLAVCSLLSIVGSSTQFNLIVTFRCFAILSNLANIVLIIAALRALKCSPRYVLLGAFLYAWNPLVLMETAFSAHNDVFMVTFLLLGFYLCARAQQKGTFLDWRGYLPVVVAFTAAVLVKFSAAVVLPIFVLAVCFATIQADSKNDKLVWKRALLSGIISTVVFGVITLACYGPFWIGHSFHDIVLGFTTLPASSDSISSVLSTFKNYNLYHALLPVLNIFKSRLLWNIINFLAMVLPIVVGCLYLWRAPDTRTIALVTLASFAGFLLSTPWFFSWYLIWLVGLLPFCVAARMNRISYTLLAFSLTFSATAFFSYYTTLIGWMLLLLKPPALTWNIWLNLGILGIPIVVLIVVWYLWPRYNKRTEQAQDTPLPSPATTSSALVE
ncbi:hypothetical protein [Dictyobacter formicarum]|uniref:Glycosyltransferase RgtA/B/C/D-like domain-containing protein n=1 Tax=Dictyobacter formicarum TaxID=2778368 RepID=A0ABQ3VQ83_9CHLR|nr:hypothetical protein [Dictyobacter formicarum]GHO87975.1 hypothetical protein KSZ_59810 [Dictyobacter formicarum]